jgi:hypothetical protein
LEEQVLRFIDESEPLRGAKVGVYFQVRDLLSRNLFSGTGSYHPMPRPVNTMYLSIPCLSVAGSTDERSPGGTGPQPPQQGTVRNPTRDRPTPAVTINDDKFFAPASNAKILTTAAALLELGPEYMFTTELLCDDPSGGNLWYRHGAVQVGSSSSEAESQWAVQECGLQECGPCSTFFF